MIMNTKKTIIEFLEEILIELKTLSENDISKLESGGYSISLKITKNKGIASKGKTITEELKSEILRELQACKTREEGNIVLSKSLTTKKEIELFAKFLDVSVLKQDKVEQIKEKIIEATVGAIIRSNVIQGKTT